MKRVFVFIFILGISNYLFSKLTRTITRDSTQVSNLRKAVTNGSAGYDEVMDQYYDKINRFSGTPHSPSISGNYYIGGVS